LDAEQSPVVKKARGTTGAKPDRDMNDAPAANQKPSPGVPAPRSAAAGLAAASAGLGEEQPGRSQKDAPDLNAAGKEEGNRGTPESAAVTFSAPHLRPVTANGADLATSAAKPMTSAAVLDEVGLGLERLQQHGNNRMDLRLSLQDGGQVSIELQVRDGAVHASFLTGSAELQNALQQGWSQLVNRSESLGLSLAEPVFKTPTAASANAGQQDFRERRHEPPQEQNSSSSPYAASQQLKRTGRPNLPARPATSGLNAWA
jgi:hypothetical protein